MVNPFRLFTEPKAKPADPPGHFIALVLRSEQDLLFDVWPSGHVGPFFSELQTNQGSLPPTLGSEGLLTWVKEAAAHIGLREASIQAHELCPPEPMLPYVNNYVHVVILDITPAAFSDLRMRHPQAVVLTVNFILQHVGQNFFYRPISQSYRVPAMAGPASSV